jgi:hypothetical protein
MPTQYGILKSQLESITMDLKSSILWAQQNPGDTQLSCPLQESGESYILTSIRGTHGIESQ